MAEKIKISLNLNKNTKTVVDEMATRSEITRTEAIKRSIHTAAFFEMARADGCEVYLKWPDGKLDKVWVVT